MAFQHWYCELCGHENTVRHEKHAGAYEVILSIGSQHRKKSPKCENRNGTSRVRLGFPSTSAVEPK